MSQENGATSVAKTILNQLGGHKFVVMTGARGFVGGPNNLSFRIPGGAGFAKSGINVVKITLGPGDLYYMEFSKMRKQRGIPSFKLIKEYREVFFDQLQPLFTEATGLRTSL